MRKSRRPHAISDRNDSPTRAGADAVQVPGRRRLDLEHCSSLAPITGKARLRGQGHTDLALLGTACSAASPSKDRSESRAAAGKRFHLQDQLHPPDDAGGSDEDATASTARHPEDGRGPGSDMPPARDFPTLSSSRPRSPAGFLGPRSPGKHEATRRSLTKRKRFGLIIKDSEGREKSDILSLRPRLRLSTGPSHSWSGGEAETR